MNKNQKSLLIQAGTVVGVVAVAYAKAKHEERKHRRAVANERGWRFNTMRDTDARIDLNLAFNEIVKDLD